MRETTEQIVRGVLEPGEQILWSGRPDVEAALKYHAKSIWRGRIIGIAVVSFIGVLVVMGQGESAPSWLATIDLSKLADSMPDNKYLWVLAAPVLMPILLPLLKFDLRSRLQRYYRSQTYAITDRRLLVLQGGNLMKIRSGTQAAYPPDAIHKLELRERGQGCGDVIFARYNISSTGDSSANILTREKGLVGFKAQSNARQLMQKIEDWNQSYFTQQAGKVADFSHRASSSAQAMPEDNSQAIENGALGLKLRSPSEWSVQVRYKKKPFGTTFIDREKWQDPEASQRWNLVKIEGPGSNAVEVEVFATQGTASYESLAHSGLAGGLAGKIIDANPDFEWSGLSGFTVCREISIPRGSRTGVESIGGDRISKRVIVLQEQNRQVVITAHWVDEQAELKRVVHAIVESIELS